MKSHDSKSPQPIENSTSDPIPQKKTPPVVLDPKYVVVYVFIPSYILGFIIAMPKKTVHPEGLLP
jgi:hypothetical protein